MLTTNFSNFSSNENSTPNQGQKPLFRFFGGMIMLLFATIVSFSSLKAQTISATASTANFSFATGTNASLALDFNSNAVDMTSGTTSLVASATDNGASAVTNIGFNFPFGGDNWTQFSVSSNEIGRAHV